MKRLIAVMFLIAAIAGFVGATNFSGQLSVNGVSVLGGSGALMTGGDVYFVSPLATLGSDQNDGKDISHPFLTITKALEATTAGQNDVIYYLASDTSYTSTCTIHMDKSFVHLVGVCAETQEGQRARIFGTALSSITPLISVTGKGCSIRNIYFNSAINSAGALTCGYVSGDECYFENTNFRGGGTSDQDVATGYSLSLDGAVEDTFRNCVIGNSQVARTAGAELVMDGNTSRCIFDSCIIYGKIGHASTHPLVKVYDGDGIEGHVWFNDCIFEYVSTNQAYSGTSVFSVPAMTGSTDSIVLKDCIGISGNLADIGWETGSRGVMSINMSSPSAAGDYGKATQ